LIQMSPVHTTRPSPTFFRSSALGRQSRQVTTSDAAEFQPLEVSSPVRESSFSLFSPPIEDLASLTEDDFRRIFSHSPIKRAKFRDRKSTRLNSSHQII